MELKEAVSIALESLDKKKDPSCDNKDSPTDWKSRVNKFNSQEVCTGGRLYSNMESDAAAHEKKGLGVVPKKVAGTKWNLDICTKVFFPVQAHHLIPKNFLPKHPVCAFLAIKYKDDDEYELENDSCYDTDHADNGYCMPYASPMSEWRGNADNKLYVAFKVMDIVGVQLHQGSHAKVLNAKKLELMAGEVVTPLVDDAPASGDDYEEDEIHAPGYLNEVERFLDVVQAKTLSHIETCNICKKGKSGDKTLIQPLKAVEKMMHQASKIIKVLASVNVLYVSGYAYIYAFRRGHLSLDDEKKRVLIKVTKRKLKSALK